MTKAYCLCSTVVDSDHNTKDHPTMAAETVFNLCKINHGVKIGRFNDQNLLFVLHRRQRVLSCRPPYHPAISPAPFLSADCI